MSKQSESRSATADRGKRHGRDGNFRMATWTYVCALATVALLSLGTHILVDTMVRGQQETARIVNIAGRQRMLSQRIALLAVELTLPIDARRQASLSSEMEGTVALLEASQAALSHGSAEQGIPAEHSPAITALYRGDPLHLDGRVAAYASLARSYLALPPDQRETSPILAEMLNVAHWQLRDSLDKAVRVYQSESETAIHHLRVTLLGVVATIWLALLAEAHYIFRPMLKKLRAAHATLLEMALTDPLTGSMNRRHLMELATEEFARARRHGRPLSVLMIDIDHFKAINDTWGHAVGDEAILTLARVVRVNLRISDMLGRIGGEEFAVLLPETAQAEALLAAEKLRARIAEQPVYANTGEIPMTVSIGVSEIVPADPDFMTIMERADQALYAAKQAGRNRTVAWRRPIPAEPAADIAE